MGSIGRRQALVALLALLGASVCRDAAADAGAPHRVAGELPGYLLAVEATHVEPCGGSAGALCLDVGLRLDLATGDAATWRRAEQTARRVRRIARDDVERRCAPPALLAVLANNRQTLAAGSHRGISRRFRVDEVALIHGRRVFGNRLPLVLKAVRQRIVAWRDAGGDPALATALLEQLAGAPHYRVRPGVVIPLHVERRLVTLAREFYQRRKRRLLVTSGTRSARQQAEAMYTKLRVGGRTRGLYRKWRAAGAIERVYRRGRARRWSRARVIAAMTAEISSQIAQRVFVSPHLQAGAVDLRSRSLRRRGRRTLLRIARRMPGICQIKLERRPPHFHLRFATAAGDCLPDDRDLP